MSVAIEDRIRVFADEVEAAPDFDDYEELLGLFEWREGLADEVPFEPNLSEDLRERYAVAERRFQELLPMLRERFPQALAHERARIARRVSA